MSARTRVRSLLVLVIALAGPSMLALDIVIRHFFLGAQPADVRAFLAEHVTPLAWCIVPLPLVGGIVGYRSYPSRFRARLERWRRDATLSAEAASERADLEALFLATTLAQLPAVLGDLSLILGAGLAPVVCSTTIATAAVLAIGLSGPSRAEA